MSTYSTSGLPSYNTSSMIIMPEKVTTQTIAPNSHNDNEYVKAYASGIKKPGDFQVLQNQLSGMRSLESSIIIF